MVLACASPAPPLPAVGVHAGSGACAPCHAGAQAAWAGSHHAGAEAELGPAELDALSILPGATVQDGRATIGVTTDEDPDGIGAITHRIGVAPLWQPVVTVAGGRRRVLPDAWDPARREWFKATSAAGPSLVRNSQCAPCHDTGVTVGYAPDSDRYDTILAEVGVGCEACHGPAARHAAAPEAPVPIPAPGDETCAPCHSRRVPLGEHHLPTAGAWLDGFLPLVPGEGELYWPDGQVRDEVFEAVSFAGSRMAAAGVGCTACHEPHGGKVRAQGDALCLGCHAGRPGFADHDPHPEAAAVACVDCHMPMTVYMERHPRRDHGFTIPDPALGVQAGVPDACSRCHNQGAAWAADAASRWWGASDRPSARRGRALSGADATALLDLAATDPLPFWRGVALRALGPHADAPEVYARLTAALADPDGWVRLGAAQGLADAGARDALAPALRDPLRAIRLVAARARSRDLRPGTPEAAELEAWLAATADQPLGALAAGRWALERGDAVAALLRLRRAAAWDPSHAETRLTLAFAALRAGGVPEAERELAEATRLAPELAEAWLALALVQSERGDLEAARSTLAAGLRARPEHAGLRDAAARLR